MAISFVSISSMWSSSAASTSYTINTPASIAAGDLLIAVVAWSTGTLVTDLTCTAPSGWTKVDETFNSGDGWDGQLAILTRTATGSETSTYSGTLSANSAKVKVTTVAAYRGVQGVLVKGINSTGLSTSYSTATVNNTQANSWRFVAGMYESSSLSYNLNTNEATSRALIGDINSGSSDAVQVRVADSGAAVATGNTSRTFSRSASWDASCAWIAILQETTSTPATGTLGSSLKAPVAVTLGEVHDDATIAATLPSVSMVSDGTGSPQPSSGTLGATLGIPVTDVTGATEPRGTLDVVVLPSLNFQVETRVFGIRVITVENDASRRIIVPSRGVDD